MAEYTRVSPSLRIAKLLEFNQRLQNTPQSMDILREWQVKLDKNLVEVPGRQLNLQKIMYGFGKR